MKFLKFCLPIFLLLGCCKHPKSPPQNTTSRFVNLSFPTDPRSFDPAIGLDNPTILLIKMLFEGLTHINLKGEPELAIAKSYTLSDDQKTYTFKLRDTKWSNGDRLIAQDFAAAWKRVINPKESTTLGASVLYCIKNARAIFKEGKPLESLGVEVIDDETLQVTLEYPVPHFLESLASPPFLPIHSRLVSENPDWALLSGDNFVCNGPFKLLDYRVNDAIIVVKNPAYWEAQHVQIPGIHISIIQDLATQIALYQSKKIDWLGRPLSRLHPDAFEHFKKSEELQSASGLSVYWVFINVESIPFQNKKMRQAFAYALDRKLLTEFVTEGGEVPATGIVPPAIATQKTPFFDDCNLSLARQLFNEALDEMGLTKEELPLMTIKSANSSFHKKLFEALQSQWRDAFGVNVRLQVQDWQVHYADLQSGNYQLGAMGWQSWVKDPMYFMQTFRHKYDGFNMSNWENQEYQNLLFAAERAIDPLKRKTAFNRAESLLMQEMPVIPLFFCRNQYCKQSDLEGVMFCDTPLIDFRWSYFEK